MRNENSGRGVGIFTVVGIVFIVLKLCKVIAWSWLWVLAPFWIPFGIMAIMLLITFIADKVEHLTKDDNIY